MIFYRVHPNAKGIFKKNSNPAPKSPNSYPLQGDSDDNNFSKKLHAFIRAIFFQIEPGPQLQQHLDTAAFHRNNIEI